MHEFSLFINDLALDLKNLNIGIQFGNKILSILLYADDMVLLAASEKDLQTMLDTLSKWCKMWRVKISQPRTNIVHFRPKRINRSNFEFRLSGFKVEFVRSYKYLGVIFDVYLSFEDCINTLAQSAGRALGGIISKSKFINDLG